MVSCSYGGVWRLLYDCKYLPSRCMEENTIHNHTALFKKSKNTSSYFSKVLCLQLLSIVFLMAKAPYFCHSGVFTHFAHINVGSGRKVEFSNHSESSKFERKVEKSRGTLVAVVHGSGHHYDA